MRAQDLKYTYGTGIFPNWSAINATGPGLTDGSEYVAETINDGWEGVSQAIMAYASGAALWNNPSGDVGIPNNSYEIQGASQILQAIQRSHAIGPGSYVIWSRPDTPTITKDRVIILGGQGVDVSLYPALNDAVWVGPDPANLNTFLAGGKFYRSSDPAGTIPDEAGNYLQLPDQPESIFLKRYSEENGDFTITCPLSQQTWITAVDSTIIPFRTIDGSYFVYVDIRGSITPLGATSQCILDISNIVPRDNNVGQVMHTFGAAILTPPDYSTQKWADFMLIYASPTPNTARIDIRWTTGPISVGRIAMSSIFKLISKPTFPTIDSSQYKLGIVY